MMPGAGRGLALAAGTVAVEVSAGGRRLRILDVAALQCPAGAQVALTGPSGSGKTTLLGALAGLYGPGAGRIDWGGTDISRLTSRERDAWRLRHVGLVFQEAELVPELDVTENVLLPARFSRFAVPGAIRVRAASLIRRVGLATPGRRAAALSSGERQRAAVARALLLDPPVILADEPTASLDRETARQVGDLLVEVARESGATLVVATHDADLAARFARTWSIRDGRVAASRTEAA